MGGEKVLGKTNLDLWRPLHKQLVGSLIEKKIHGQPYPNKRFVRWFCYTESFSADFVQTQNNVFCCGELKTFHFECELGFLVCFEWQLHTFNFVHFCKSALYSILHILLHTKYFFVFFVTIWDRQLSFLSIYPSMHPSICYIIYESLSLVFPWWWSQHRRYFELVTLECMMACSNSGIFCFGGKKLSDRCVLCVQLPILELGTKQTRLIITSPHVSHMCCFYL